MRAAPLVTRRTYLTLKALEKGVSFDLATEGVATTALAHPEWDMEERRTWHGWESATVPRQRKPS